MYFNQASPRTPHQAQCQHDAASSALTSGIDGRVKYEQRQHWILGLISSGDIFFSYERLQPMQVTDSL